MRRFWPVLCFLGLSYADDTQLSGYGQYPHAGVEQTGTGGFYEISLSRHALIGLGLSVTPKDRQQLVVSARSRWVWQSGDVQHGYPLIAWQYNLTAQRGQLALGAGWQIPLVSGFSSFAETDYGERQGFTFRVGARFSFSQWAGLDNRLRRSEPKGVTYKTSIKTDAALSELLLITETDEAEVLQTPTPMPDTPAAIDATVTPANIEPDQRPLQPLAPPGTVLINGSYLNLGVFRFYQSLQSLADDERLLPYRSRLMGWYDAKSDRYRLLLGPDTETQLKKTQQALSRQQIESYVFVVDTETQ